MIPSMVLPFGIFAVFQTLDLKHLSRKAHGVPQPFFWILTMIGPVYNCTFVVSTILWISWMVGTCLTPGTSSIDPDSGSEKPPPSSVQTGWLVLGVVPQLENRRSCQCAVESSRFSAFLNNQHLWYLSSLLDFLVGRHLSLYHPKTKWNHTDKRCRTNAVAAHQYPRICSIVR